MSSDAVVRVRMSSELKHKTMATLSGMGINASDLIRLTFLHVAENGRLPFALEIPNHETRQAMADLDAGKGVRFDNAETLFEDLGI